MEFHKLGLEHIELVRPYFKNCKHRICDCTVGGTFMWRDYFQTNFCIEGDTLFIRVDNLGGGTAFGTPVGGNLTDGIKKILEYCAEHNIPPVICMVPEDSLEEVLALTGGRAETDRAWYDYLYTSEDIKNLAGRKYSGQRNHINKFLKENEEYSFEAIDETNLDTAKAFLQTFIDADDGLHRTLTEGNRKAMEILENYHDFDLCGGILSARGKVIGLSIGETLGDTLFVHVEKSLREVQGAYPMLVREFARMFAVEGINYINREEDDGNEGLRTSKLSYHPVKLLEKHLVIA